MRRSACLAMNTVSTARGIVSAKPGGRPLEAADEKIYVDQARQGDRGAFRVLVDAYQDTVARSVVAMLGPVAEVDDVVQDAFINCFQSLDRFRGDASFATYVKKIAINRALDVLRRRKRFRGRFLSRDDDTHQVAEPVRDANEEQDVAERSRMVHAAIQQLPPKHRAVVVLRMIEGYSTEETADMLNLAYGTVLSRLSRAQKKLKVLLAPHVA